MNNTLINELQNRITALDGSEPFAELLRLAAAAQPVLPALDATNLIDKINAAADGLSASSSLAELVAASNALRGATNAGSAGAPLRATTLFDAALANDYTDEHGHRYLRNGFIETNTDKFDLAVWQDKWPVAGEDRTIDEATARYYGLPLYIPGDDLWTVLFGHGREVFYSIEIDGTFVDSTGSSGASTSAYEPTRKTLTVGGANLNEVCLCANANIIRYTPDIRGAGTWPTVSVSGLGTIVGLTFSNGRYIAVDSTGVCKALIGDMSATGWTALPSVPSGFGGAIAAIGNTIVCIDSDSNVYVLADDTTWIEQSQISLYTGRYMLGVVNGRFVILQYGDSIWTSTDGLTWRVDTTYGLSLPGSGLYAYGGLYYADGMYIYMQIVASSALPAVYLSHNLTDWVSLDWPIGSTFGGLATDGNQLLFVSKRNGINIMQVVTPAQFAGSYALGDEHPFARRAFTRIS